MGVTYLLDTHVFLWLMGEPERVPAPIRSELAESGTEILVSAASAMEVATKVRLGRLEPARHLVDTWLARVHDLRARELAVSTPHALLAGSLTWAHRDPFDRLLVAQALIGNVALVTSDPAMSTVAGLRVRW